MKHFFLLVLLFLASTSFGQDFESLSKQILDEGIELYRNERASWISTDSIPEQDRALVNGYFTYSNEGNFTSIYVDQSNENVVYRFTFQPVGVLEIELIKTERHVPLSDIEQRILNVRKQAIGLSSMWYNQFGYSQIVNPNVIIFKTAPQFEVYVIPGATQHGLLPIGGDLRMTFKPDGELNTIDPIHNNLIPFETETSEEIAYLAHQHRGKRLEKEYITSTDVCTLLLYRSYLKGEKHLTVHKKFISEFYFQEPRLVIRSNTEKLKLR